MTDADREPTSELLEGFILLFDIRNILSIRQLVQWALRWMVIHVGMLSKGAWGQEHKVENFYNILGMQGCLQIYISMVNS